MSLLIDSDTHLFEPSGMWREYVDPADRDVALHMGTDEPRLHLADVRRPSPQPGRPASPRRRRRDRGISTAPGGRLARRVRPRGVHRELFRPRGSPPSTGQGRLRFLDHVSELRDQLGATPPARSARHVGQHDGVEPVDRRGGGTRQGAALPGGAFEPAGPRMARGAARRHSPRVASVWA